MVERLWRFALIWAFMFWQGGFFFYTSVVVPIAQTEIGHTGQGFITRHVAFWINASGITALVLIALEAFIHADPVRWRRQVAWGFWLALVACQIVLSVLYPRMNDMLDPLTHSHEPDFRPLHRVYLWTHTVQWAFALGSLWCLLASWRTRDGNQ